MQPGLGCPSQPLTPTPVGCRCPGPHGRHAEADPRRPAHQVLGGGPDPLLHRQCQHGLALPDPGLPAPCPPTFPGHSLLHRCPASNYTLFGPRVLSPVLNGFLPTSYQESPQIQPSLPSTCRGSLGRPLSPVTAARPSTGHSRPSPPTWASLLILWMPPLSPALSWVTLGTQR